MEGFHSRLGLGLASLGLLAHPAKLLAQLIASGLCRGALRLEPPLFRIEEVCVRAAMTVDLELSG